MPVTLDPAPRDAVATQVARLQPHLSDLTRERLTKLLALMGVDHCIVYSDAYAALFPDSPAGKAAKARADKSFNQFRDTLAAVAAEQGAVLALKVDQRRNADPADRRLWFVAEDDSVERITRFNEGAIQALPGPAELQEQYLSVQSEGIAPTLLLVYAASEQAEARTLADKLKVQLVAGSCLWPVRDWHGVPPGEHRDATQRVWLQEATLVLVLTSPALIADVKTGELALGTHRPLLPLALRPVTPDQLEGTPLAGLSVYGRQGADAWTARGGSGRDVWIAGAARQVLARICGPIGGRTGASPVLRDLRDLLSQLHSRRADDCDDAHYVPQILKGEADPEGRPAIDFLVEWLRDPEGDVFCAVFGELGMGKTTLCQRLTRVLLDRRKHAPDEEAGLPLPVYLDLRAVNTMGWDWSRTVPELGPMLDHLIGAAYNIPAGQPRPGADQIARLAQEQGGLIIFDGLDEVMNRLSPEQCRLFIHRLWGILPPALWKRPPDAPSDWERPAGLGRLVMTCRSHFFQTLQDQLSALDGQQREAVSRRDYLWVTLLPFSAGQVETYFRQVFGADPDRVARVLAMLDQVHNLRELSTRPYNLRLIQDQVETLETIQREGGRVGVADLYEGMVTLWTHRDDTKHRLNRDHKLLLMERLALWLWSRQQADLPYQALENWLLDALAAEPRWQLVYQAYLNRENGTDILQEDLRNASFLVRAGEDRFRFAHTSIMEFFLARALHRALVEDRPDDWAVQVPSPETLDFLGGLIAVRETGACMGALARIRAAYRPKVSELALASALRAHAGDMPGAEFAGFQLPGVELRFQRWEGREDRQMDWRGSDFSGARLDGGRFTDCDFSGSLLNGTDLSRTLFDRCRLDLVRAKRVDLTGTVFHDCSAVGADLDCARFYHSQWLGELSLRTEAEPPAFFASALVPVPTDARPATVVGHSDALVCLKVSPTGCWLGSAGDDGRVRIWDLASGRQLHALTGHRGGVTALATALDGNWLASAGVDGRVRMWHSSSGRLLYELQGHERPVRVLATAQDGRWLTSAGDDSRVRIWDATSGQLLHALEGHQGAVVALAAAPDGRWLASAGDDGFVRLWDPAAGQLLYALGWHQGGHQGAVVALAAAPDGRWLASAGDDGRVRLWDPAAGQLLHHLEGHGDTVVALAAAVDGRWLASASRNGDVCVWDPIGGRLFFVLNGQGSRHFALVASPDGHWLASAGNDGMVRIWDPSSGRRLYVLGHEGGVRAMAAAPNGCLLISAGNDGTMRIWEPASGRLLHALAGHGGKVRALAVAQDGRWLASASVDGKVRIWDATKGRLLYALEGHGSRVSVLAAAPDGRWLAAAGDDDSVRIWDPASGRLLHTLEGHGDGVAALAAAPDGRWLAAAGEDLGVRIWDPASGRLLQALEAHGDWVPALVAAPDGCWLASSGDDGRVRLWDPSRWLLLNVVEAQVDRVWVLAAAAGERWLASAGADGRVRIWDPPSGRLLQVLEGHEGGVRALAGSPNGCWLASGGDDGTVRIWDPESGRQLHILEGYADWVLSLAAAPDGRWLAVADEASVRIWTIPLDGAAPVCATAFEHLPEGNWVTWHDPDGPNRRWVHWSRDAWRWLGWHAPLPDGKHWMYHPMDAFRAAPPS